jgi:hypothetical protein
LQGGQFSSPRLRSCRAAIATEPADDLRQRLDRDERTLGQPRAVYQILWVRGFRDPTISGRGFNLFKPLRRHFRAASVLPSGPPSPRSRRARRRAFGRPVEPARAKPRFLPHFVSFQGFARRKISLSVVAPIPYSSRRGAATAGNDDLCHRPAPRRSFASPHAGERAPSPGARRRDLNAVVVSHAPSPRPAR